MTAPPRRSVCDGDDDGQTKPSVTATTGNETSGTTRKADWLRIIIPLIVYAALAFVAWKLGLLKAKNVAKLSQSPGIAGLPWLEIGFVGLYATVATLALPVGPLAYAAGALFGFLRGATYVWLGSMAGAVAGYFLARTVLGPSARRLLGRYRQKLHDLRKGNVFLTSFRMQLLPIVPFGAFNYAAAISKFAPLPFLGGTALGIIPGTLIATFVGDELLAGMTGNRRKPLFIAISIALGLMALSFVPALIGKLKKR